MKTLENAIIKVEQINSFMLCVEDAMIDAAAEADDMTGSMRTLHNLVYILIDQLHSLGEDLDEVNGHIKVSNAIMASAHVRAMESELAALRGKIEK